MQVHFFFFCPVRQPTLRRIVTATIISLAWVRFVTGVLHICVYVWPFQTVCRCLASQTGNHGSWFPSEQTNGHSNQTGGYHDSNNAAAQKLTSRTDKEALFQTFRVCTHERSDKTTAVLHLSALLGPSRQEPGCKQECAQAVSTKSTTALSAAESPVISHQPTLT